VKGVVFCDGLEKGFFLRDVPLVGEVDGEDICVAAELADSVVDAGGYVAGELTHGRLVDYKAVLGEADCGGSVEVGDMGGLPVRWSGWWFGLFGREGGRWGLEFGEGEESFEVDC
jgi:hypothetical protein